MEHRGFLEPGRFVKEYARFWSNIFCTRRKDAADGVKLKTVCQISDSTQGWGGTCQRDGAHEIDNRS